MARDPSGDPIRVASACGRSVRTFRLLYDELAGEVETVKLFKDYPFEAQRADAFFEDVDLFHLHWPEHVFGHSPGAHRALLESLERCGVPVAWTLHNLVPHRPEQRPDGAELYALWARAASAVIHHSAWGREKALSRYDFDPGALHRVIPHGHFGDLRAGVPELDRAAIEEEMGLGPCALRLGIVGSPRREKNHQLAMDAFAACRRRDLQLVHFSLAPGERVPTDPRIHATRRAFVSREDYNRRLRVIDLLVFPIEEGELLTCGVVADALALALPALISDWPYLREVLGDAGLVYGRTAEELTAYLDRLELGAVRRAAAACAARREDYAWPEIAAQHLELFRQVLQPSHESRGEEAP